MEETSEVGEPIEPQYFTLSDPEIEDRKSIEAETENGSDCEEWSRCRYRWNRMQSCTSVSQPVVNKLVGTDKNTGLHVKAEKQSVPKAKIMVQKLFKPLKAIHVPVMRKILVRKVVKHVQKPSVRKQIDQNQTPVQVMPPQKAKRGQKVQVKHPHVHPDAHVQSVTKEQVWTLCKILKKRLQYLRHLMWKFRNTPVPSSDTRQTWRNISPNSGGNVTEGRLCRL